jgi:hypothetical protein
MPRPADVNALGLQELESMYKNLLTPDYDIIDLVDRV